jgi:hypothetical protein
MLKLRLKNLNIDNPQGDISHWGFFMPSTGSWLQQLRKQTQRLPVGDFLFKEDI